MLHYDRAHLFQDHATLVPCQSSTSAESVQVCFIRHYTFYTQHLRFFSFQRQIYLILSVKSVKKCKQVKQTYYHSSLTTRYQVVAQIKPESGSTRIRITAGCFTALVSPNQFRHSVTSVLRGSYASIRRMLLSQLRRSDMLLRVILITLRLAEAYLIAISFM